MRTLDGCRFLRLCLTVCLALLVGGHVIDISLCAAWGAIGLFGFIPGLTVLTRIQRGGRLRDLLAAVFLSLPLSTLLFALTRMAGLSPTLSAWSIGLLFTAAALGMSRGSGANWRLSRGDRGALAVAVVAAGLIGLAMLAPGVRASWHGFFHAAIVEQILNAGVPPSNPGLVGEALNFYWAFHVFIALITAAANISPLTVIAALNAILLALSLLIAYEVSRPLLRRTGDRLLCMAALLGAIDTGAGLVLLVKLVRFGTVPGDAYSDGTWIDWLSQRAIPGRLWDGRVSSLVKEYYDISGMAAGMTLFFAYMWLWISGPRRWGGWFVPLLIAIAVTLTAWYPPLALPAFAHLGITLLFRIRKNIWLARNDWRALMVHGAVVLFCAVFLALYFRSVTDSSGWAVAGDPFISLKITFRSVVGAITPYGILIPFVFMGLIVTAKLNGSPSSRQLILFTIVLFAFASAAVMQQNTQYKFVYVLSLPLAILAVQGLRVLINRFHPAYRYARLTYILFALILVHPAVIFAVGAATSQQHRDASLYIQGRHIVDRTDPSRMECLAWIRDRAPRDAVLLLPLIVHERSPSNPGFREPAMAQRAALLVHDLYHSLRFEVYEARAAILQNLFDRGEMRAAGNALKTNGPGNPAYAVVRAKEAAKDVVGWTPVFANESWAVFRNDTAGG